MAGYGTDDQFTQWLTDNGYTLPAGSPAPAVLRQRGSQYVDALYGDRFIGTLAGFDQERAWPRTGVSLRGVPVPASAVPLPVIYASFYAALTEARNPDSLNTMGSASSIVVREKVGALETQFAGVQGLDVAAALTPLISIVDGMLTPYLRNPHAACFGIRSVG